MMDTGWDRWLAVSAVLIAGCVLGYWVGKGSLLPLLLMGGVVFVWTTWRWPMVMLVSIGSLVLLEGEGVVANIVIP